MSDRVLHVFLDQPLLREARRGRMALVNRLAEAVAPLGWQIDLRRTGARPLAQSAELPGWTLVHMAKPPHDRALTFRQAYHHPFWRIERQAERWRWPVALAEFEPSAVDPARAAAFAARLRAKALPGPEPRRGPHVLVPLQARLTETRSFQTMSPLAMLEAVAATGRPVITTLHPRHPPDDAERRALAAVLARHPNLSLGEDSAAALRNCLFVAAENSAVAFDGYILGKPAVLFAQIDFHHIALNVADLGAEAALAQAPGHRPPFAAYLDWFLRGHAIRLQGAAADAQILAALRRGGVPI